MSDPYGRPRDANPFADSTLYELNTTYVPPDLPEATVDAVVPAVPTAVAAAAAAGGGRAQQQQPAAAPPPGPATASGPAVPAAGGTVPALQFTESNLSHTHVAGNMGRAGTPVLPSAGAAAGGGMGRPASAPPGPQQFSSAATSLPGDAGDPSQYPFWNVRRYRPYFDVDTKDVVWRVGSSFLGPFKPDFMAATWARPDLYGPFWVATTLIFVTAVAGNYADLLTYRSSAARQGSGGSGNSTAADGGSSSMVAHQWYTDYAKMSYSALLFYGYVFVLGLALFFALRWFRSEIKLANVWCIYGYSLTIFIPSAFVCIAPLGWLRWVAVMAATGLSGLFIVANLKQTIYEAAPGRAVMLLGVLAGLHAGVGLALRLYFFRYRGAPEQQGGTAAG